MINFLKDNFASMWRMNYREENGNRGTIQQTTIVVQAGDKDSLIER